MYIKNGKQISRDENRMNPFIPNIILSYEKQLFQYKERMKTYTSQHRVILKSGTHSNSDV